MAGVIVLGGHIQAYGIVRVFGENNIPSIVIDTSFKNIAKHSNYCIKFYQADYNNLISLLLHFAEIRIYENWVLFPTDDYYVRILSKNRETLEKYFKVTVDKWEIVKLFYNKKYTYPIVKSLNIPIPKTYYPTSIDNIYLEKDNIEFPCIIKPAIMLDFYRHFKKKVFICKDIDELEKYYQLASQILRPSEILIQEIIPGSSENQYSVGIFFNRTESYNYIIGRRKRQHPINFGNATTYAETVDIPILYNYSAEILKRTNYFGICEVEFKYDERDRKFKFLEVNPRTWKWHLLAYKAEVPLLLSIYSFLQNNNPIISKIVKPATWQDIITDFPVMLFLLWKNKIYKAKTKNNIAAVANTKDISPFLYQLIYSLYYIFKR